MAFNSNFTRVTLGTDPATGGQALFVEGRSQPPDLSEIHVAVPHNGQLVSARVPDPDLTPWEVQLPVAAPPVAVGDDVFVVGVALRPAPCDPFVWQGSFSIASSGDV
ncbi:MAG TPA: hypothetical protein VK501_22605 [Baekduia sp.]|uniref:hypothetical protein n=1 Tax=Baekduia sp. TaxID=2600305 RepID=UPI002CC52CD1|nr:hypothetical protein [Baekduia sp.]HMJ36714.1 hypothetical protein [Baekduia sp.]